MARNTFTLEAEQVERLQEAMQNYAGYAGETVDEVLHSEGAELIKNEIMRLLPVSGRKPWKGKKTAAKYAQPFTQENGMLSVTVKSKPAYHYLYFPDDGSNTKKHRGNQQFMMHGAENKTSEILDRCINRLIEKWESD